MVLTTDYVLRGVSQTDGGAAAQADLHVRSERGWFAGAWASTADPPPGYIAHYELDLYAGRSWNLSNRWTATVIYVRYLYPDSIPGGAYDSDELSASLAFEDRAALTVSASPNATRYAGYGWVARGRMLSYEASLRQPIFGPVAVTAAAGFYDTEDVLGASYWAWNVGLSALAGPVELTLTRFGVDATGRNLFQSDSADGRWVLAAAWRF